MTHPFGTAAIKLGFTTEERVTECLAVETERQKLGEAKTLQELLQDKGYLSADQVSKVLDQLQVPRVNIPGYELLQPLGHGGMGAVYLAKQVKMNRLVAIKFLSNQLAADTDFVKRFIAEAQTAAQFNHRHLVAAYDAGTMNGLVYFVMEYVKGKSLRSAVEKQGPMGERNALLAAASVGEALRALEERGLVHRDVKPENVMVTDTGIVKLCDFGLAKVPQSRDSSLTGTGAVIGTPSYMSPEQIRGDPIDVRADFYALGGTLYCLTTGKPPFEGPSPTAVLAKHLEQPVPDPRAANPTLSAGFAALVARLLAKKREDRPTNSGELLREIRALLDPSKQASQHAAPAVRLPAPWIAAAIAGVVALSIAVTLFFVLRRGETKPALPPLIPIVDSKRETDAANLWAEAQGLFGRHEWAAAKEKAETLKRTLADTDFVKGGAGKLAGFAASCDKAIDDEKTAARKEREKIEAEVAAGRWQLARDAIAKSRDPAAYMDADKTCRIEIDAEALIARIDELRRDGKWEELAKVEGTTPLALRESKTAKGREDWLKQIRAEVQRERAAIETMRDLRVAAAGHDWKLVQGLAKTMRETHKSTRTYQDAGDEVAQILQKAADAGREGRDVDARRLFDQACAMADQGQPGNALEKFRALESNFKETQFYREHAKAIADRRAACTKQIAERKEQEALLMYQAAMKLKAEKKYEEAREAFEAIRTLFGDTRAAREHASDIEKALAEMPVIRTLIDCESISAWTAGTETSAKVTLKEAKDAKQGLKSVRASYPKMGTAKFAAAMTPVSIDDEAASLQFWVRHEGSGAIKMAVVLLEAGEKDSYEVFIHPFDVKAEWRDVELKIADFTYQQSKGKPNDQKLQIGKVGVIGFALFEADKPVNVLIDDIREKLRK